jgi:flagellar biosynthesis chaperone FliJ
MKRLILCVLFLLSLAACSKPDAAHEDIAVAASPRLAAAPLQKTASFLAYEHAVSIVTEGDRLAALFEAAQAACRQAAAEQCTILESQLNTGRGVSASLRFRAKPEGIQKVLAVLTAQAKVSNQSTTAEDLEAPIADSTKKLAMLKDYRDKLEALRARGSNDIDALIKLNRELAQVQSDIESYEGTRAHLMQRVDTEILRVSMESADEQTFWGPIRNALEDFAGHLSQGFSMAITTIAFCTPWVLLLALVLVLVRALWRRRKKFRG